LFSNSVRTVESLLCYKRRVLNLLVFVSSRALLEIILMAAHNLRLRRFFHHLGTYLFAHWDRFLLSYPSYWGVFH